MSLLVLAAAGLLAGSPPNADADSRWPLVQEAEHRYVVSDGAHARIDLDILDTSGRALYHLRCRTWASQDDNDFDYSGDLECRLVAVKPKTKRESWNLLSDVATADLETLGKVKDWEHRGRFLALELAPKCLDYPDLGAVRVFELRGMRLTLALEDYAVRDVTQRPIELPGISHFTLVVSIRRAPDAVRPFPKPSEYEAPLCVETPGTDCVALDCRSPKRRQGPGER